MNIIPLIPIFRSPFGTKLPYILSQFHRDVYIFLTNAVISANFSLDRRGERWYYKIKVKESQSQIAETEVIVGEYVGFN